MKSYPAPQSAAGTISEPVTVVAIDDHSTLGQLLGMAIHGRDDMTFLGYAVGAAAGLELVARTEPDVVVMDLQLSDRDGLQTAAQITQDRPGLRLIVLTAVEEPGIVQRAASAGACAFLAKSGRLAQLFTAIRTARRGHMMVDARLLAATSGQVTPPRPGGTAPLTGREREVLEQLALGLDATRIARRLTITINTSRGHIKSIMSKLHCHTQLETLAAASRLGLVQVGHGVTAGSSARVR